MPLVRVVDANGKPLARVGITAVRSGATDTGSFYRDHHARTRTDEDGMFEFRLLAPGSYTLRAPDGFQRDSPPPRVPHGRGVLADLELASFEIAGLELRLPPEGRISGMVVDARGHPVTDAWVCAPDESGLSLSGPWEAQTDASGYFELVSVSPGTRSVRVRAGERDVTSSSFSVEAGRTASCRIELP